MYVVLRRTASRWPGAGRRNANAPQMERTVVERARGGAIHSAARGTDRVAGVHAVAAHVLITRPVSAICKCLAGPVLCVRRVFRGRPVGAERNHLRRQSPMNRTRRRVTVHVCRPHLKPGVHACAQHHPRVMRVPPASNVRRTAQARYGTHHARDAGARWERAPPQSPHAPSTSELVQGLAQGADVPKTHHLIV